MRYKPSCGWIIGCSPRRTRAPSKVFASFLKRRIPTRAVRHFSCWPANPSLNACFSSIEKFAASPTHAIGDTDLCRWKSSEHLKQSTHALLHVLVLQRTGSRARANTSGTLGCPTIPPYPQYRQSWSHRTSAGRLDLQKVQLFELEAQKSLPDVLSLYGFISPYAHSRDLTPSFIADAEGNGDSISTTVQAERIALLANTIRGREFHSLPPSPSSAVHERPLRRSSLPLQALAATQQSSGDVYRYDGRLMSRSLSYQNDWFPNSRQPSPGNLRSPGSENPKTLYQTSLGNRSSPSFAPGTATYSPTHANIPPSGPLLPSFLQDIVQSPSLSPASSTDFSLEDYSNDELEPGRLNKFNEANIPYRGVHSSLALRSTTSLTNMFNIWKLDGDETRGW